MKYYKDLIQTVGVYLSSFTIFGDIKRNKKSSETPPPPPPPPKKKSENDQLKKEKKKEGFFCLPDPQSVKKIP